MACEFETVKSIRKTPQNTGLQTKSGRKKLQLFQDDILFIEYQ